MSIFLFLIRSFLGGIFIHFQFLKYIFIFHCPYKVELILIFKKMIAHPENRDQLLQKHKNHGQVSLQPIRQVHMDTSLPWPAPGDWHRGGEGQAIL